MIHRAVLGSVERMLAILTEHYAGKWPFWLSPRQVIICPLPKKFDTYAQAVHQRLSYEGIQVGIDVSNHTIDKKVRNAQMDQYNFILVIGAQEVESNTVNVRNREGEILGKKTIDELIQFFKSLSPQKSKQELRILEQINSLGSSSESELSVLENKLKYNLYVNGEDLGEEDKKLYAIYKDQDIDKDSYPNVFKWKKLVSKSA